jgi:hypothetical protein
MNVSFEQIMQLVNVVLVPAAVYMANILREFNRDLRTIGERLAAIEASIHSVGKRRTDRGE